MSVLVLTGSARTASYTRALGEALAAALPDAHLAPRLTGLPFFDQDLEASPPAEVLALRAQVAAADAVVVVTPEYNGTIPGLLGNAIDWLSRPYAAGALVGKPVLAVAASPGGVGGARAVVALRTVLGNAGADLLGAAVTVDTVDQRLQDGSIAAVVGEVAELLQPLTAARAA
ncbi:MAG: NAD(P)H-dependent oxidoreductase [Frankiales bacterium]|jgi:NAD(P)H-dependent FMN reductase|nr:NAD(P)H-dependent oxidoreductase [Frankiales bacterium]